MTDVGWGTGPRIPLLVAGLLVLIAVFGIVDLALDAPRTWRQLHGIVEIIFIALCLGSAYALGRAWQRSEGSLRRTRQALEAHQADRDAWKLRAESLLRGLGAAIDEQLDAWRLSPDEKETALLLLKGFSHKEVAQLSERSERTVRQHAVSVYRKSGLAGRAELSAFFLEDLLLPPRSVEDSAPLGRDPG
jgi:DNA-binding CsgD family transcriptional regulator